ncbi:hypothetical protein [Polyangium spumosum]|uniref:MYXO-CTERM sorting domain-containing protein n=1 Tax=Polyangium spumosum TaxID=889282 RepID=A0A6N7Q2I5_9BACT|nr:hypothetical protein [Polyangium spumosum]MRG97406.1 hypothetical protein [Polyangium spumosum]
MRAFNSQDKRSSTRRLCGALLALAALVGPAIAAADEVARDEESCMSKKAGDTCADPAGAPGTCVAAKDFRDRERLRCVAGAKTPTPTPSAATTSVVEKKGCAVSAAGDQDRGAPLAIGFALAALALGRARRRAAG